jgi:hypothetical protein
MGTCQVPIPVLARSITNNGKYLLPVLMNFTVFWKNADKKVNTLVSSSMGTSTGNGMPRIGFGNLHVWVPTHTSFCTDMDIEKAEGGKKILTLPEKLLTSSTPIIVMFHLSTQLVASMMQVEGYFCAY